jgi:hypothetical protein
MNNFLKSQKAKAVLIILAAIVILLLAFGFGIAVGYRRAIFASRYGENYSRNFEGDPFGAVMGGPPPMNTHGVAGVVIDVSTSTISVKDMHGNEQSVAVPSDTSIREMDDMIVLSDIQPGDSVTVIGEPNDEGQVEARFIRVFSASSTQ